MLFGYIYLIVNNVNGLQKGKKHNISDEAHNKLSSTHKGKHWSLVDGKRVWY